MGNMAHIISIVNQKGGVGKTTTSVNLSASLAEHFGKKVLLVDMDPQANATSGLGVDYRKLDAGIYEAIIGDKTLPEIVTDSYVKNLKIAPAHAGLTGASIELVNVDEREYCLKKILDTVSDAYDFIFIDNAPSLGLLTLNGLVASDQVLIPVQSEYYALEGLGQLLHTVHLVKQGLNPDLEILGVVVTMFDARNNLSGQILEELYKHFPHRIFRSTIPRNIRLTEAPSHGKSVFHYDARSKGATSYQRLAKEFLGIYPHINPHTNPPQSMQSSHE